MKVETRKITVEKNVYIAEDGREFYDKSDCEKHDSTLIEKSLKFYNKKFAPSDLESCTYVYLRSANEVVKLIKLCNFEGITTDGLDEVGVYVYDERSDRWINMSEAIEKIEAMQ